MTEYVLSCDWGTSSFRLRLVETASGRVLGEHTAATGVAATFDAWKKANQQDGIKREPFYRRFLKSQINALADSLSLSLEKIPLVLSGMASSSIGIVEVPYADLPVSLDGGQVSIRRFDPLADFDHLLLLVSGVRSANDVMRGEETQLIGLGDRLADIKQALLIFPGTHSKHLYVQGNQLIDFRTYMTGELFEILAAYSILKASVEATNLLNRLRLDATAFLGGVRASASTLLHSLFSVRTNQLFGVLDRPDNALYLSGLLIGAELRQLQAQPDWPLVLCCDNNLVDFYELALLELGLMERATRFDANLIRYSALSGQLKILKNQLFSVGTDL